MGRKQQKKEKEQEEQDEEVNQEEDQYSIPEVDEEDALNDEEEHDLHKQHQQVLEIIKTLTAEGPEEERMTWLALYSLKKKEVDLNEKMLEEIDLLKDKYDLLKQPIYSDIASAAIGRKLDLSLYKIGEQEKSIDPSKINPSALPDYWLNVFEKSGLIEEKEDVEAFSKLQEFNSELLDPATSHLRLTFKFREETALFSNKVLTIESKNTVQNDAINHEVKIKEAVKWKGKKSQNSVFSTLFDPATNPSEVCELMGEFYRDFCNSIYFYMRKGELEDIEGLEEDDQQLEEAAKPAKKQKKELKKPECQQQ